MNIEFTNRQTVLPVSPIALKRLVSTFLNWKGVCCDEVSVHFVDKKEISRLHAEFFNDPSPTDCISFPIDSPTDHPKGYVVLGEVFVCPEVGVEYAIKEGLNPYEEVSLYTIHALLHLLGFDDQTEKDRMVMRGEENSAMHYLKENGVLIHE
ncbi:MAG: rRNA maturation RNase YbeY [Chlamydiia bacterium]|nr:rRNA maturation RNase YbeY [Chlamydiia bacterium]